MNDDAGEAGFTLIEMLITMMLILLVIAPISAAIFLGLHTESDVQVRLAESNSAGQFASYFGPDVQQSLVAGVDTAESGVVCGASAKSVALLLTQVPGQSSVSYFVDAANPKLLRRRTCAGGAVTGPPAGIAVIRNLSGTPLFACDTPGCASWQSVSATVSQIVSGKNPYTTSLQGTRRVQ